MYRLICMSFDGEYQTERPTFETVQDAWEYSEDLGSKWFFYPFHFVTTESAKTIVATPDMMHHFERVRTRTVARHFATVAALPEAQNVGVEQFAFMV